MMQQTGVDAGAGRATRVNLRDGHSPAMRAFHLSWVAFFLSFFGWFGIAPLMAVVRDDLHLNKSQVGNLVIASVAATVVARLVIGWALDRVGPRRTYAALLVLGALPVLGLGLVQGYTGLLVCRLCIGALGAGFVITQYHNSVMFATNVIGLANAATAGWGNFGGTATQLAMPLVYSAVLATGCPKSLAWRVAMVAPAMLLIACGVAYYRLTQDSPAGDFGDLRRAGRLAQPQRGSVWQAARDYRVWVLFLAYGGCFGVELTIDNIGALYYHDHFHLGLTAAGAVIACYGLLNLFARALGGWLSDRVSHQSGLAGRVRLLTVVLLCEAGGLMLFSQTSRLWPAIGCMLLFGLFMKMSEGACFAVVPFINREALGPVTGLVGAGGNIGAVLGGFLFKSAALTTPQALCYLGGLAAVAAVGTTAVRFSPAVEFDERRALREATLTPPALAAGAD